MSLEAWGDENPNIANNGTETQMYHDLIPVVEAYRKWFWANKEGFFSSDTMHFAESILDKLDELREEFDVKL